MNLYNSHIKSHYSLWRNQRDWTVGSRRVSLCLMTLWPRSRGAVGPLVRQSSRSQTLLLVAWSPLHLLWASCVSGRRPAEVWGSDTARAAEIFLRFGLLPSRRRASVHWLESGAARQGRSMRIDQRGAAAGCGFEGAACYSPPQLH